MGMTLRCPLRRAYVAVRDSVTRSSVVVNVVYVGTSSIVVLTTVSVIVLVDWTVEIDCEAANVVVCCTTVVCPTVTVLVTEHCVAVLQFGSCEAANA